MSKQQKAGARGPSGRGGWRRWSDAEGADAVMRWRSSGLSVAEFAALEGLSAQRVHRWRRRLGLGPEVGPEEKRGKRVLAAPVAFMRVAPTTAATHPFHKENAVPPLTLRVEHEGVTVSVREDIGAATLATVVHALREGARRC